MTPDASAPPLLLRVWPAVEELEARLAPAVVTVSPGDNIQAKINAASPGDTLTFVAAEFDQQFTVDRDLTLLGNGAIIQAPAMLAPTNFGGTSVHDIIDITGGATVTITGFTVAGPGPGQFNSIDDGIFVFGGATATISGCTIRDIRDDPLSGMQTGVGIQVGWASLGQVGRATLTNDAVLGSQKGNIVIDGAGSTATIDACTVTGVGPTPTIAENGIQVSRGAVATITNCVISGHSYTGVYGGPDPLADTQSCGLLFYAAGDGSSASGNVVTQNDIGIYANGDGAITLNGNALTDNPDEGIFVDQGTTAVAGNTISGSLIGVCVASFGGNTADSVATVTSNTIGGNGTAIALLNDTPGNPTQPQLTAHFNRIIGNGVTNTTPGAADVTLNWWGSNAGPGSSVSGADASTWLVLTLTVGNPMLHQGESTTVTADLRHDSTGPVHTEGFVPDGAAVHFAAVSGGVNPADATTVQGQAATTYTAPYGFVTDTVSATVDSQTVSQSLNVCLRNAYWTDATGDQSWNTPLNWDFGYLGSGVHGLPGPCDDVVVFASAPGSQVVHDTGSVTIHSLHDLKRLNFAGSLALAADSEISGAFTFGGTLQMQGGFLAMQGGGEVTGAVQVFAGSEVNFQSGRFRIGINTPVPSLGLISLGMYIPDPRLPNPFVTVVVQSTVENLRLLAGTTLRLDATLTILESLDWLGGAVEGAQSVEISTDATMTVSGFDTKTIARTTVHVARGGSIDWESGIIEVLPGAATFTVDAGGLFEIKGDVTMLAERVLPVIQIDGTLLKSGGTGTALLQARVGIDGTLSVDSGTLNVYELSFIGGTIDGQGDLEVVNGFTWFDGTMSGAGSTFLLRGSDLRITVDPFPVRFLTRVLDRRMDVLGSGTIAGSFTLTSLADFNNYGSLNTLNRVLIATPLGSVPGDFFNAGTFRVQGALLVGAVFNNDGVVEVNRGSLALVDGGLNTGTYTAQKGTTVTFSGADQQYTFNPLLRDTDPHMLVGAGKYVIDTGAQLITAAQAQVYATNVDLAGGSLLGLGTFHVMGTLDWLSGSMAQAGCTQIDAGGVLHIRTDAVKTLSARTLVNYGTADWADDGDVELSEAAMIVTDGTYGQGLFEMRNNRSLLRVEDDKSELQLVVRDGGGFAKTSGKSKIGELPTFDVAVQNLDGFFELLGKNDTLALTKTYTQEGGFTFLEGNTLHVDGAVTVGAGGVVNLGGGTLVADQGMTVAAGALLDGPGKVVGNLVNAGTVRVSGTSGRVGTLFVSGNYQQTSTGTLIVDLAGRKQYDKLLVGGTARLDGRLVAALGFLPRGNDQFHVVVAAAPVQGTFLSVVTIPAGFGFAIQYADGVTLFL